MCEDCQEEFTKKKGLARHRRDRHTVHERKSKMIRKGSKGAGKEEKQQKEEEEEEEGN